MPKTYKRPKSIGVSNFKARTQEQKYRNMARYYRNQAELNIFLDSVEKKHGKMARASALELLRPYLRFEVEPEFSRENSLSGKTVG